MLVLILNLFIVKKYSFLTLLIAGLFASQLCFGKNYKLSDDLELIGIDGNVYIHKSYTDSERFGRFSSNGMVIIRNQKALLIDTPMTDVATKELVKGIKGHKKNPFGGMNLGIIEIETPSPDAIPRLRFILYGHKGGEPVRAFASDLIVPYSG